MIRILRIGAGSGLDMFLDGVWVGMHRRDWSWDSLDIVAGRDGAR